VDDVGDTLRLASPAKRVISLMPATTEALFAMGAGDRVVGRTTWCDYPAEALAVPDLGSGIEPNVEVIVATQPDLVVLYASTRNAAAAERLRELGIPVIQLQPDLIEDLMRALALLGTATGLVESAAEVSRTLQAGLDAVSRPRADGPELLVLAWDQPPMVIGRGSFLHQVVTRAGARNAFDDLGGSAVTVSLEAIAARDPDVILTTAEAPAFLQRPEWQVVRAVRQRRLIRVQGTEFARPSPRLPQAVRQLAARLDSLPPP